MAGRMEAAEWLLGHGADALTSTSDGLTAERLAAISGHTKVQLIIMAAAFSASYVVGLIFLITAPLLIVFMALVGAGAAAEALPEEEDPEESTGGAIVQPSSSSIVAACSAVTSSSSTFGCCFAYT